MAFSLLINGVEYNSNTFRDSFNIREALQANGSSMLATIQLSGSLEVPVGGNNVVVLKDGVVEFAGRIASVERAYPYNAVKYDIQCVDYTPDLDAQLIAETFDEGTVGDTIRSIIGYVGRGFTSNNVVTASDIGEVKVDVEQPSSVITRLAEGIEHQWYVDYNRDVHFFYVRERPAPVASIDFDTNIVDYSNLACTEDASQVKNVIYLTGAKVESTNPHTLGWIVDGEQTFFPLAYQPVALEKVSVTVDGYPITLGLDSVESEAGDGQTLEGSAYVCLDNWGVRFPDNSPPGADANVVIAYKYALDMIVKVEDPRAIEFMRLRENTTAAPSNGRHEFKFEIPDLGIVSSEDVIVEYGNLLLSRYAYPVFRISFDSWTQGWERGQTFHGVSARHGFDHDFYISSLTKQFLQSSDGVTRFKYTVEASSSPFPS